MRKSLVSRGLKRWVHCRSKGLRGKNFQVGNTAAVAGNGLRPVTSLVSDCASRSLQHDIDTQNLPDYRFQQAKYHALQELLGKFHGYPATGRTPGDAAFLTELQVSRIHRNCVLLIFPVCFLSGASCGGQSA
jgi:hypothetical protein